MGAAGEGEGGSRKPKASAPAPARRQPAPRADRATPKHNCRASGHVAPKHKRRGSGHTSWVHDDLAWKALNNGGHRERLSQNCPHLPKHNPAEGSQENPACHPPGGLAVVTGEAARRGHHTRTAKLSPVLATLLRTQHLC